MAVRCGDFGGLAAVRDENRELVRDPETKQVLTKPCPAYVVRGSTPPRCIYHLSPEDVRRRRKEKEAEYVRKHWGEMQDLLAGADVPELHPMDALLEVVRHTGSMMRVLQMLVGELPVDPDVETTVDDATGQLVTSAKPGLWGLDHNGEQASHVFVNLLGVWTDRHTRACKMALDAGIDERIVRNAEATQATLLAAFQAALRMVQLPDETRTALSRALAGELRKAIDVSSQHVSAT